MSSDNIVDKNQIHSSNLTSKDIEILISLQQDPTIKFIELAEILSISAATAANRYYSMVERTLNRVIADLEIGKLDLEIIDVFIGSENLTNSCLIENFCEAHPYTLYRSRVFGSFNGLYLQFRIPIGTKNLLISQLNELKQKSGIKWFETFSHKYPKISTTMRLENWVPETHSWNFDWDSWEAKLDSQKTQAHRTIEELDSNNEILLNQLDLLDMHILEELTKGCARRKHVDIIKAIEDKLSPTSPLRNIPKQTFSRHFKKLNQEVITGYRLFLDWRTLDMHNSIMFRCVANDQITASFYQTLERYPIPFESTIRKQGDGFFWFIRLPPAQLSDLYNIIWKNVEKLETIIFDYKSSEHYGLWHETFDVKKHKWKSLKLNI
ncbi:MAG: winged helix-turn-helix transcriptional regulator [Candidatus Hermodarchaeota archaeon]